jgi:hypothetical protein
MTQPKIVVTELDGSLGILPPAGSSVLAMVGVASAGAIATPATYARVKDVVAAFGSGPMVEAAAHYIERYGLPVLLSRATASTASSFGTIDVTGVTGTSVVTKDAAATCDDDYEAYLIVITGGTIGVSGITYQESLDNGRTLSPVKALGTANTLTITGSGGVAFDFAAGTLVAGDVVRLRCVAPNFDSTSLGVAIEAVKNSVVSWECLEICGPLDATMFDTVETKFASLFTAGKYRSWYGNCRLPTVGESEATYLTAMTAIFSAKSSSYGALGFGSCKLTSSVSGRKYKRPICMAFAAREAAQSQEINSADINLGSLVGVSIADANGNPDEHDESINPGADDARFVTLRTWDGIAGVYVNRPRVFSAAGSDFDITPKRRVLNLAHAALRSFFIRRLNAPIIVDSTTGFILESEALEIEAGAEAAMRSVLLATPKASGIQFSLSRTDNLLSTKTLTGSARVIPLAYPETINLDVGFLNPALRVVTQ